MTNGIGNTPEQSPRPTQSDLIRPIGKLRVVANMGFGLQYVRLDHAPAGVLAVTGGTITDIRLHGDVDSPRATFTLVGPTGDSAIVAVSTAVYLDSFGDLVNGRLVELTADVVRPFRNGPAHLLLRSLNLA
ncbi:chlorophyll a-b binding domain-containing protein [Streptomyces anulatus]|uniref:hypothetical protein n=1 Tax=Streptomyces anulatus TaxID=1892 RepID=UPI00367654E9